MITAELQAARWRRPSRPASSSATYACLEGPDAAIVITEWDDFRALEPARFSAMRKSYQIGSSAAWRAIRGERDGGAARTIDVCADFQTRMGDAGRTGERRETQTPPLPWLNSSGLGVNGQHHDIVRPGRIDMKEEIRRAIVSSAAKKINGSAPSAIFSHERGHHSLMSDGYDYEARAHFTDSFHHGTGSQFELTVRDNNFEGFDYGDSHPFSGSINGRTVQLYDYGEGRNLNYSI